MERDHFKFEDPHSAHDSLEVVLTAEHISITIDEPWAGDTETGFGQTATLTLPKAEAMNLAAQILRFYA